MVKVVIIGSGNVAQHLIGAFQNAQILGSEIELAQVYSRQTSSVSHLLDLEQITNDLDAFENKLLSLCQEYFLDLSKSGISITSRSKDILKKYREKQKLSKFEEAYIHEYTLKSLSALLPDFQKKIINKVELERAKEEKINQKTFEKQSKIIFLRNIIVVLFNFCLLFEISFELNKRN